MCIRFDIGEQSMSAIFLDKINICTVKLFKYLLLYEKANCERIVVNEFCSVSFYTGYSINSGINFKGWSDIQK